MLFCGISVYTAASVDNINPLYENKAWVLAEIDAVHLVLIHCWYTFLVVNHTLTAGDECWRWRLLVRIFGVCASAGKKVRHVAIVTHVWRRTVARGLSQNIRK